MPHSSHTENLYRNCSFQDRDQCSFRCTGWYTCWSGAHKVFQPFASQPYPDNMFLEEQNANHMDRGGHVLLGASSDWCFPQFAPFPENVHTTKQTKNIVYELLKAGTINQRHVSASTCYMFVFPNLSGWVAIFSPSPAPLLLVLLLLLHMHMTPHTVAA